MNITSTLNSFEQSLASALSSEKIYSVTIRELDDSHITLSASFNDIIGAINSGKLPVLMDQNHAISFSAGFYMVTAVSSNTGDVRFGYDFMNIPHQEFSAASPTSYLTYWRYN